VQNALITYYQNHKT